MRTYLFKKYLKEPEIIVMANVKLLNIYYLYIL